MARRRKKGTKIYRGAYHCFAGEKVYGEEEFEVYRNEKQEVYHFLSETTSRVSTGELLILNVEYVINFKFIPLIAIIDKAMGNDRIQERYDYDLENNRLSYMFITKDGDNQSYMHTKQSFHIATPCIASSILFILSKKFNSTSTNFYNLISCENHWEYVDKPSVKNAMLQKISSTMEMIAIAGTTVEAMQYKLWQEGTNYDFSKKQKKKEEAPPTLKIYLSRFLAIPYIVESNDGLLYKIKYLNNLTDSE
jgi:hypothetical protein